MYFIFSSRRRHTRFALVSWARACVGGTCVGTAVRATRTPATAGPLTLRPDPTHFSSRYVGEAKNAAIHKAPKQYPNQGLKGSNYHKCSRRKQYYLVSPGAQECRGSGQDGPLLEVELHTLPAVRHTVPVHHATPESASVANCFGLRRSTGAAWNAFFFRILLCSHRLMQDSATSQKNRPLRLTPR